MQKLDFIVSVGGLPNEVIRVEYEEEPIPPEIWSSPYAIMGFRMNEAVEALRKEIEHDDFEITYWEWL